MVIRPNPEQQFQGFIIKWSVDSETTMQHISLCCLVFCHVMSKEDEYKAIQSLITQKISHMRDSCVYTNNTRQIKSETNEGTNK